MKCTNDISDFLKDPQACGHNFCLKCFVKWIGMGKINCAKCHSSIPAKMAKQPRINSTLVVANRMAKTSKLIVTGGSSKGCNFCHNLDHPDKAFTMVRAKRNGKANSASVKIFVTVPSDHFGPVLGVLVGETWEGSNGLCTFHQLQELLDSQNMVHSQLCSLEGMKMMRIMKEWVLYTGRYLLYGCTLQWSL